MRPILILLLAGAAALAQTKPATPAQLADAYYTKGLAAEKAKDYQGAKSAYTEALRHNPKHPHCLYRLKQLELDKDNIQREGRAVQLDKIVIPQAIYDGATLQEALTALGNSITKESGGKQAPNFVIQDPQQKLAPAKINLNLKSLPASAVLKYILEQAGAKARFDEHAVVVFPKPA